MKYKELEDSSLNYLKKNEELKEKFKELKELCEKNLLQISFLIKNIKKYDFDFNKFKEIIKEKNKEVLVEDNFLKLNQFLNEYEGIYKNLKKDYPLSGKYFYHISKKTSTKRISTGSTTNESLFLLTQLFEEKKHPIFKFEEWYQEIPIYELNQLNIFSNNLKIEEHQLQLKYLKSYLNEKDCFPKQIIEFHKTLITKKNINNKDYEDIYKNILNFILIDRKNSIRGNEYNKFKKIIEYSNKNEFFKDKKIIQNISNEMKNPKEFNNKNFHFIYKCMDFIDKEEYNQEDDLIENLKFLLINESKIYNIIFKEKIKFSTFVFDATKDLEHKKIFKIKKDEIEDILKDFIPKIEKHENAKKLNNALKEYLKVINSKDVGETRELFFDNKFISEKLLELKNESKKWKNINNEDNNLNISDLNQNIFI